MSAPRVCSRCGVSTDESGRPPDAVRSVQNDGNERLAAFEKKVEELGLSIIRAIEDSLRGGQSTPEARPRQEPVALARTTITSQLPSLPREQQGGEWGVVRSKKMKRRKRKGSRMRRRTRSTWLRLQKVHSLGEGQIIPQNPRLPHRQGLQPKSRKECRFQHQERSGSLAYRDHQQLL
jgi:hypothetical protein